MHPCEKCLENNWTFKKMRDVDEEKKTYTKWSLATCICGHEVEFGHKELNLYKESGERRFSEDGKEQKGGYVIKDGKHLWDAEDGSPLVEMDIFRISKKGNKDHKGKAIKIMAV